MCSVMFDFYVNMIRFNDAQVASKMLFLGMIMIMFLEEIAFESVE